MNPRMWANPAVQDNVALLKKRGIAFIGPEAGHVACGEQGTGRLASIDDILSAILRMQKG